MHQTALPREQVKVFPYNLSFPPRKTSSHIPVSKYSFNLECSKLSHVMLFKEGSFQIALFLMQLPSCTECNWKSTTELTYWLGGSDICADSPSSNAFHFLVLNAFIPPCSSPGLHSSHFFTDNLPGQAGCSVWLQISLSRRHRIWQALEIQALQSSSNGGPHFMECGIHLCWCSTVWGGCLTLPNR